ncbi:MAG: septum site-determining protein MinC [Acetobacteraceae bacterium]|nr:septum site-determining protein MinC [Acetobacteraceae bacterium]
MNDDSIARPQLRLRGRSFIAVALAPEPPVMEWLARLDAQIERAPSFFVGRPVVLDLSATKLNEPGVRTLLVELTARKIQIIGIEGADPAVQAVDAPGWPPMLNGGRTASAITIPDEPTPPPREQEAPPPPEEPASLLIKEPIRSGQSIVFPKGDVTIVGSVGSGAEVMAGGSIHVYGTLRGRAIAGMIGNPEARIFCRRLEAELLAIDGLYRTAEDMDPQLRGRPVQAWLDRDSIVMATLD